MCSVTLHNPSDYALGLCDITWWGYTWKSPGRHATTITPGISILMYTLSMNFDLNPGIKWQWNLSKDTMKWQMHKTHFLSQTPCLCTLQLLKSGTHFSEASTQLSNCLMQKFLLVYNNGNRNSIACLSYLFLIKNILTKNNNGKL